LKNRKGEAVVRGGAERVKLIFAGEGLYKPYILHHGVGLIMQGIIMMKQLFLLMAAFLFLLGLPCPGMAQTAVPVAIMPFVGDDLGQSLLLHEAVIAELEGMSGYIPLPVSADDFPETRSLSPNEPPSPNILGNSTYVLTGEYYADIDDEWHFQFWLWRSATGALVYTDELTAQDVDEARTYLPALMAWAFSLVPVDTIVIRQEVPAAVETAKEPAPASSEPIAAPNAREKEPVNYLNRWLYLGGRIGGAFSTYRLDGFKEYELNAGQSLGYEASLLLAFRFLSFMSIQAEAVFSPDTAIFRAPAIQPPAGSDFIYYTEIYQARSLIFPVVLKFPIQLNYLLLSPYAGGFVGLPLGEMEKASADPYGSKGSFAFEQALPLGLVGGLEMGVALGPGVVFVDLRYGLDLDKTRISDDRGLKYTRHRITFSLGYQFALFEKRPKRN
jgi:hypothetical protein